MTLSDFTFEFRGSGHYKVTYTSPNTGRKWSALITDMTIIDVTKNAEQPKQKDLYNLKFRCKRGNPVN